MRYYHAFIYVSGFLLHSTFGSKHAQTHRYQLKSRSDADILRPMQDPTKPYQYVHGDLDLASFPDFPPGGYIGYGLDMTQTSPLDIETVADVVKGQVSILKLDEVTDAQVLPGTAQNVTWKIPRNCNYDRSKHSFFDTLTTYANGSVAAEKLSNSDTIGGSYRCVKGDVSVAVGLRRELDDNRSWAFYAYIYDVVSVEIRNYLQWFNESAVESALLDLPYWPTGSGPDQDTVKRYRNVFNTIGTHIITSANYGSRLELRVSAENYDKEVAANFETDVKVSLQGLPSAGEFRANVSGSAQYKTFQKSVHNQFSCRGGNSTLCSIVHRTLTSNDSYDNLIEWQKTAQDEPDLTSLGVVELWSVLRSAQSPKLRAYEISLQNAFTYLVENPLTHYTICAIIVSSAWGEIGMLTPGVDIVDVEKIEPVLGVVEASLASIKFHTRDGQAAHGVRIQFKIRNNGSPFDIELSHGTNGYGGIAAAIEFIATPLGLDEVRIKNDQMVDKDPTNREEFHGIPADPRGLATGIIGSNSTANGHPAQNSNTTETSDFSGKSSLSASAILPLRSNPPSDIAYKRDVKYAGE